MADKLKTDGIVGPVRLSYLTVFAPRLNQMKGTREFGLVLLIPKLPNEYCPDPKAVGAEITEMIRNAARAKFGAESKGWKTPLKDGDADMDESGEPKNPGFYTIRASCKDEYPPVLVDGQGVPVTGGWESGDWGRVKLSMWTYDQSGNKGVSAGLRAVQFLYKDDPLGLSSDPTVVAREFGTVENAHQPVYTGPTVTDPPAGSGPNGEYDPFAD